MLDALVSLDTLEIMVLAAVPGLFVLFLILKMILWMIGSSVRSTRKAFR